MSDKNLFEAIQRRDLQAVSEMIHMKCPTCTSPDPKRHPAMQFEGEISLCEDAFHVPTAANIRQRDADLRARLSLEQRDEPRESWSNIDSDSGQPKSGPL